MLQKPRRGWWFLPGGKLEPTELWPEAASREVREETGLNVCGLHLRGVFLLTILGEPHHPPTMRTIVQFSADYADGAMFEHTREGILRIVSEQELSELPMDLGDKRMLKHTLRAISERDSQVAFGRFTYTPEHHLLDWSILPEGMLAQTQANAWEENHP